MELRFTLRALTDLDVIHRRIAQHDRATADRFVADLRTALDVLTLFPESGGARHGLPEGVRVFVIGRYIALYRIEDDAVIVEGVVRAGRDLEGLFDG